MLSGGELIERLREAFLPSQMRLSYRFPMTYIGIGTPSFTGEWEDDEVELARMLHLSLAELRALSNRLYLRFDVASSLDELPSSPADRGHSWSRLLWTSALQGSGAHTTSIKDPLTAHVIHFYGYKGGQARSTVLGFLGRLLADEGWRVLAVDVDAEAPTLDVLLDVRAPDPSGTLVGLRGDLEPTPFRARTGPSGRGALDLLAFRPRDPQFDLDAAALAMEMAIAPPFTHRLMDRVGALRDDYDLILVDHRTGLAATVPPWVERLPGPVVVFSRMDQQWEGALHHIEELWSLHPQQPGALVTFKSDTGNPFKFMLHAQPQAHVLLERLANVVNAAAEEDAEPTIAEDLMDHWLVWPFDPAFGRGVLPRREDVSGEVLDVIRDLRRLLGLTHRTERAEKSAPTLHPSGALDEGHLIVTQALRELDTDNSAKWFVLGRKGTGKTRLMRELAVRERGEPLLVATEQVESEKDEVRFGLPASHPALTQLWSRHQKHPQSFWWALVRAALRAGTQRTPLVDAIEAEPSTDPMTEVVDRAQALESRRVFLIDGLETAFPRESTFSAIDALFRVWSALDADSRLSRSVRMRIFIRTDLAQRGYENLEQLLHDRTLKLEWDTQSILNFALSRIHARSWYRQHFSSVHEAIDGQIDEIREGALDVATCEDLLLGVFPQRLRRQNMLTTTFLRTWFSDDPSGRYGYYPRIYDKFLEEVSVRQVDDPIVQDRVNESLVFEAHESATEDFLQQVKVELNNLVDLGPNDVERLLEAFRGRVTPFAVGEEARELALRTNLDRGAVRQALEQMRILGIFEERPGYDGQWRAGRLFKTSLGMLYNRRRKSN